MNEERLKILKMVEDKKISAEEASRLLDALGSGAEEPASGGAKMLRIRVYERDREKPKVNINVPLSLVKWGLKFIPQSAKAKIDEHDIDLDEIISMVEKGNQGKLVDVEDDEDGERVEIFIA